MNETPLPYHRPRRLRGNPVLRDAISETRIGLDNLMYPIFVADLAPGTKRPVQCMPGVFQHSLDSLAQTIAGLTQKGVRSFMLFGVPPEKDAQASGATSKDGIVPRALRAVRDKVGDAAFLCTDVCLCSYTDHGHCGVLQEVGGTPQVHNDLSLELLADTALAHAEAGADMVAPSDMMDGRIAAIRQRLDDHDLTHVPVMSYAIKYASSMYGPFRHAADSAPKVGDRRSYQMDFRNRTEALREASLDIDEGADILLVKPGLAYLDILADLREECDVPLAMYQVSGEYSMIRYAAAADAIDERGVVLETWTAMRRAGATIILTYHAAMAAEKGWLKP